MALRAADDPALAALANIAMAQADFARMMVVHEFYHLMQERWPHYVHYHGRGRPSHCPPDAFHFSTKRGPSACDWIVPGTL